MIGKTIGKYRIVEKLGRGGMGTVYKAVDETLDREVAVKVLNPELTESDVMNRFRVEATTLARLNHPEIATIHEIYRSDSDLLMVMEFVRGETLDQLSQRSGALAPEHAASLVAQVLGALEHAHNAGIVHRDLKPANVMVTEHGGIKIMDFGIARVAGAEHLTSDGHMMGTPAYMAPEQVMAKDVDGRADIYSCGVVLYRLLTGILPFQADTAIGMVQKQLAEAPTPVNVHRADIPAWCQTVLDRALAKSPADRYQTAGEFRAALMTAIGVSATEHTGVLAAAHLQGATRLAPPSPAAAAAPAASRPAVPAAQNGPGDGATIVLKKNHFAMAGGLLALLAIGVAILAVVALRRTPVVAPEPVTPAAETAQPGQVAAAVPAAAAAPEAVPPSGTPAAPARSTTAAGSAGGGAAVARRADASAAPRAASAPAAEAARGRKDGKEVVPPFVFDAKAVVVAGGKNREHDAKVRLADGTVTVTENDDRVVTSFAYTAVLSLSFSNAKQPMWNAPGGPAEVVKVEGGALGFLKGSRNWLVFHTKDASVVLRVDDDEVRPVIAAIEERTGRTIERVAERKN